MDASGAPVTDELTGVHHSPQRDAIYEPEKTARRKAHRAAGLLDAKTHHVHLHNFTRAAQAELSLGGGLHLYSSLSLHKVLNLLQNINIYMAHPPVVVCADKK